MLGVDLVYIPEFQNQLTLGGQAFLDKAFHPSETQDSSVEHLAGLWAAKEAVIKAADVLPAKMSDIRISQDTAGKPHGRIGKNEFAVSIAHHGDYAVAIASRIGQ